MADDLHPPQSTKRDSAIAISKAVAKGTLGAVPVAGALLAEVTDLLFREPINKRRDEWMSDVADAIEAIRATQGSMTPEKLASNEEFVTILHRATDVAIRTHERSKRALLRNAVVNSVLPDAPNLDLQSYFLRLVDELSVNQIIILALYDDPAAWFRRHSIQPPELLAGSRMEVLNTAYPALARYKYVLELQVGDLERRSLLGGLAGNVSGSAILNRVTSTLGHEFLAFIRSGDGQIDLDPAV